MAEPTSRIRGCHLGHHLGLESERRAGLSESSPPVHRLASVPPAQFVVFTDGEVGFTALLGNRPRRLPCQSGESSAVRTPGCLLPSPPRYRPHLQRLWRECRNGAGDGLCRFACRFSRRSLPTASADDHRTWRALRLGRGEGSEQGPRGWASWHLRRRQAFTGLNIVQLAFVGLALAGGRVAIVTGCVWGLGTGLDGADVGLATSGYPTLVCPPNHRSPVPHLHVVGGCVRAATGDVDRRRIVRGRHDSIDGPVCSLWSFVA